MRVMVVALLAFASGCSQPETTPAQREADVEKAIAEVEAAQTPPPDVVTPERITPEDRSRFKLSTGGCSFAVDNPELGSLAILQLNTGFMKFDGAIDRFAPDPGGGEGPVGTSRRYDSGRHSLQVDYPEGIGTEQGSETMRYLARITLLDGRDREVYVAEGFAFCGS